MSTLEIIALVVSIVALIAAVVNVSMIIARDKKVREEKRMQYLSEQRLRRPFAPETVDKSGPTAFQTKMHISPKSTPVLDEAQLAAHGFHLQSPSDMDAETREALAAEQTEKRMPDDIKKALSICVTGISENCDLCPYSGRGCDMKLTRDSLAYIEFLERSEREFAEQQYDLAEFRCERCIHNGECAAIAEEDSWAKIPREKCIEGVIAFKRKEWEQRHENG